MDEGKRGVERNKEEIFSRLTPGHLSVGGLQVLTCNDRGKRQLGPLFSVSLWKPHHGMMSLHWLTR